MNGLRYESLPKSDETANRGQVILMSVSELELDAKSRPPRSYVNTKHTMDMVCFVFRKQPALLSYVTASRSDVSLSPQTEKQARPGRECL